MRRIDGIIPRSPFSNLHNHDRSEATLRRTRPRGDALQARSLARPRALRAPLQMAACSRTAAADSAVFGTNSEANSLSVDERMVLLETLIQEGVPAAALMPGHRLVVRLTDSCGSRRTRPARLRRRPDAASLLLQGRVRRRPVPELCRGDRSASAMRALQLYLYHIPPVSQVPITLALIERLLRTFF